MRNVKCKLQNEEGWKNSVFGALLRSVGKVGKESMCPGGVMGPRVIGEKSVFQLYSEAVTRVLF